MATILEHDDTQKPYALMAANAPALEQRGAELTQTTNAIAVIDQETFERAARRRQELKLFVAQVKAEFDPVVASAYETHRKAVALRKRVLEPAEQAEKALRDRMDAYEARVETERRRLEEEQGRERQRLQDEADQQAAQLTEGLVQEAAEDQLAAALAAEAEGDAGLAARILEQPIVTAPVMPVPVILPPVAVMKPAAPGVTYSTTWKAEITGLLELVRAVASGRVPLMVTLPNGKLAPIFEANQVWLDAQARTQKETLRIPGVKAVPIRRSSVSAS